MKKHCLVRLCILVLACSIILASCATTGATAPESSPTQEISSFELYCDSIQDRFTIDVSLPNDYTTNTSARYPVIIMTDGYWRIEDHKNIHRFASQGKLKEMIVVGIGYPDGYDFGTIRDRDFIYGADKFLAFIVDDVIPKIDADYRTDTTDRTLLGVSNGGYFATYALLQSFGKSKGVFKNYIIASPTLINSTNDQDINDLEETLYANTKELPVNVFMAVGALESQEFFIEPFNEFVEKIEARGYEGLNLTSIIGSGEDHETLWKPALYQALVKYLSP